MDDRVAFRTTRGTPLLRYAGLTGALDNVVPFPSADARDWMREQEELYPASLPGDLPEPRPLKQKVIWTDPKTGEQFWATKDFRGSTFPHRDQPVRTKTAIELTDEDNPHRERWNQGDTAHFEYHCNQSPDSPDYYLWQHTQQPVEVLGLEDCDDFSDQMNHQERMDEGVPLSYRVRFSDGVEGPAFEDELLNHPKHFSDQFAFKEENRHDKPRTAAIELSDEEWAKAKAALEEGKFKGKLGPPQKVKTNPNWLQLMLDQTGLAAGPHEGPWYHASPHDLPEGTVLTPGGAPAASKDFYDQGFGEDRGTLQDMGGGRAEHVWLSPNREDAGFWSAVNGAPHIYEVDPEEDPRPWNGTGTDGWVTPRATIRRKVSATETPATGKIYRGLQLDLPPEVEAHIKAHWDKQYPTDESEIGGHLQIGPVLLDHLQKSHPLRTNEFVPEPDIGLGRHWTTNKRFAEIAAQQGGPGGRGKHSIVLEADHPGEQYLDSEAPYVGGLHKPDEIQWRGEEEHTLRPKAPLNITSVMLNGAEVLHDPYLEKWMPVDYGKDYPGGPQLRYALDYHSPYWGSPGWSNPRDKPQEFTLKDHLPSDMAWMGPGYGEYAGSPSSPYDQTQSGKWYHTSPYRLEPGTKLTPGGAPSPGGEDWYGRTYVNRPNHVWLSPNMDRAKGWRDWAGQHAYIYEVHPGDRPQPWNFDGEAGWVAPHATIKHEVDDEGNPVRMASYHGYDDTAWHNSVWDEDLDEDDEAEEEHKRHAFAPPPTDDEWEVPEESKWEVPPLPGAKPHEFFHDWFEYCLQREQEEAAEAAQRHSYLGIEPDMNVQRQVRKFDRYIQQARDIGDHGLADYATHLKEQMLDGVANGRPQPFSYWIPMAEEEFG